SVRHPPGAVPIILESLQTLHSSRPDTARWWSDPGVGPAELLQRLRADIWLEVEDPSPHPLKQEMGLLPIRQGNGQLQQPGGLRGINVVVAKEIFFDKFDSGKDHVSVGLAGGAETTDQFVDCSHSRSPKQWGTPRPALLLGSP